LSFPTQLSPNYFSKPILGSSLIEGNSRKFQSCSNNLLHSLDTQNRGNQKCFVINSKQVFGRFLSECIATIVLGGIRSDNEVMRVHQVAECIEEDMHQLNESLRFLLSSFAPRLIKTKVFSKEVDEFFEQQIKRLCNAIVKTADTKRRDFIQLLTETSKEEDASTISAHILMFFTGG
jgi:Cytochrome P450